MVRLSARALACALALVASAMATAQAQIVPAAAPGGPASQPAAPQDSLGRHTPRGTVLGFLRSARKGDDDRARLYLDSNLSDEAAATLAHELLAVLEARLPARLTELSDLPEGSRSNRLTPNLEVVGTISSATGPVDVVLERVERGTTGPIWLFSSRTLQSIPALAEETTQAERGAVLPEFLIRTRLGGIRLFEWLAVLLGLPLFFFLALLLNRILTSLTGLLLRRLFRRSGFRRDVLPMPVRLLILAVSVRWLVSSLPLTLAVRQFWIVTASLITVAGVVWLLLLVSGDVEQFILRRFPHSNVAAAVSLLRLVRRTADTVVVIAGVLATLRLFSVDLTPALAGLGVGGIAVALAAQRTLENVIAGASLIFDQAVDRGDWLKVGDIQGTVDHIGLRSTRIRTFDRTIVTVPNGQIAHDTLETLSARDKYWFHPVVRLRYETTAEQLRAVAEGIRRMLGGHPSVEHESARVRFWELGTSSLDLDVFAYVFARDWIHFLEIQEELLFSLTELIEKAGTRIAIPSRTVYLARTPAVQPVEGSISTR